jgi:hypothetical protein
MSSTKLGCFRSCSWCLWKALDKEEGCMGLVPWCCGAKVLEYWMIFSLKLKLNRSWKFRRNWNLPLVLLERSWWAGFNGIYLVRFGFKVWEILIFKWFLPLETQINSKKPGFGRKNQLRNVVTLEGLPFNSSMISFHIWLFKISIHTLQNNVHSNLLITLVRKWGFLHLSNLKWQQTKDSFN